MSSGITIDRSIAEFATMRFAGANFSGNSANPIYYPPDTSVPHSTLRSDALGQGTGYFDPIRYLDALGAMKIGWEFIGTGASRGPHFLMHKDLQTDRYGDKEFDIIIDNGVLRRWTTSSSGGDTGFDTNYNQTEIEAAGSSQNVKNFTENGISVIDFANSDIQILDGESGTLEIWVVAGVCFYSGGDGRTYGAGALTDNSEFDGVDQWTACLPIIIELEDGLVKSFQFGDDVYSSAETGINVGDKINDEIIIDTIGATTGVIDIDLFYGCAIDGREFFSGRTWWPAVERQVALYRTLRLKITNGLFETFEFIDSGLQSINVGTSSPSVSLRCAIQYQGGTNETFGTAVDNALEDRYYPNGVSAINDSWTPAV